jgi:hypothetical protein
MYRNKNAVVIGISRSQWPRSIRRGFAAACWDYGFESHRGHGCLWLVNVVCCQVEVSATGRSLVQSSRTECVCVSLSVVRCAQQ